MASFQIREAVIKALPQSIVTGLTASQRGSVSRAWGLGASVIR